MKPIVIALVGSLSQTELQKLADEGYIVLQERMSASVRVVNKTLRDEFAAHALEAYIAHTAQYEEKMDADLAARAAYIYADAMLAERDNQ